MKRLSISTKRRKSFQMSLLLIIGIWVVTSTSKFVYLNFFSSWSDAAGYVSLLDQIRAGHGMLSPMYNAGTWFFEINSHTSVHTWCEFPSVNRYANFSRWHPYLILFPLGTLANILHISSLSLLSILTSISYLAPIFHIFYFLYFKHQKSLYLSASASILAMSFPVWFGGLEGQLQSDRLLVGPAYFICLALLCSSTKELKNKKIIYLSIFCIITATISERAAIYLLLVLFVSILNLSLKKRHRQMLKLLPVFSIIFTYLILWDTVVQDSTYYGNTSLRYFIDNVYRSFFGIPKLTILFIIVISPFLLVASRNILSLQIVILVVLPQFLWTTGGSEKTGFITQYHAGYLGFLLAAFVFALSGQGKQSRSTSKSLLESPQKLAPIYILILLTSLIGSSSQAHQLQPLKIFRNLGLDAPTMSHLAKVKVEKVALIGDLPKNSWISAPETMMPALTFTGHHDVDYFPMGLRFNSYAIENLQPNGDPQVISPWLESLLPSDPTNRDSVLGCFANSLIDSEKIRSASIGGSEYRVLKLTPLERYRRFP